MILQPPIIDELLAQNSGGLDPRWKNASANAAVPQDQDVVLLFVRGYTEEYWPRFYFVRCVLDPDELAALSFDERYETIGVHILNMIRQLNTFLDHRCMCFPGEFGQVGRPCDWHAIGNPDDWSPEQ